MQQHCSVEQSIKQFVVFVISVASVQLHQFMKQSIKQSVASIASVAKSDSSF